MNAGTVQLRHQGALTLYQTYGWEAIPLYPNSKKPCIEWAEPANLGEADRIFKEHLDANIAVVLGRRSGGLACQDFEYEEDYQTFYGEKHEELEKSTLVCKTPHGGVHVMHYSKEAFRKKVRICEDHPIDVLGEGCVAVMPPSQIDGRRYEVIDSWRITLLDRSDNLLASTAAKIKDLGWKTSQPKRGFELEQVFNGVPEGQRNESAFRYAAHLLSSVKLDFDTAYFELERWNRLNKPPLPERELASVIHSAIKYGKQDRRRVSGAWR